MSMYFAHALQKGQGGVCLTDALPGRAFTAVRVEEKGARPGQRGFNYSTEAKVKNKYEK